MKLAGLLPIILLTVSITSKAEDSALQVGDVVPPYLGKTVNGQSISVADFTGKVVVISFWASWCAPCLEEMPVLENIQNHVGHNEMEIVAINYKEDRRQFKKIIRKLSETSLTHTHDGRGSIGKKYGVEAIPHLFVIDRTGKLAFQKKGYGEAELDKLVEVINEQLSINKRL